MTPTTVDNPLLEIQFEIPFDQIRAENVEPAVERLLQDSRDELDRLISEPGTRTFTNTLERLDHLTEIFGEDRVLFRSDWPNSDGSARLDQVVSIVKEYFASKPQLVAEKYFWRNSARVYKWIKRQPDQPALA